MTRIYECDWCGVVTESPEQVCAPQRRENMGVYCGEPGEPDRMCEPKKEHLAFVCGSCGRPTDQAEMVCNPKVTG